METQHEMKMTQFTLLKHFMAFCFKIYWCVPKKKNVLTFLYFNSNIVTCFGSEMTSLFRGHHQTLLFQHLSTFLYAMATLDKMENHGLIMFLLKLYLSYSEIKMAYRYMLILKAINGDKILQQYNKKLQEIIRF